MLTLTYALVALSVEQKKVQGRLLELQQAVQKARILKSGAGQSSVESRIEKLLEEFAQLEEAFGSRNIELYVLPAIRSITPDADQLLAEIDAIATKGRIVLRNIRSNLRKISACGESEIADIFDSLEVHCQNLIKRLTIEELHILPLAQRTISSDEWFDIAAKFISHESEKRPRKIFMQEMLDVLPVSYGLTQQSGNLYQTAV